MRALKNAATVALAEVADVLKEHGTLACAPLVEFTPAAITLTLTIPKNDLDTLALLHELEFIEGVGNVRAFAQLYGIDANALHTLLETLRQR